MKKQISKSATDVFAKAMFHNIPKIIEYIKELPDKRKKNVRYPMEYIVMSEMCMLNSKGGSQRYTEKAFNKEKCLENICKMGKIEKVEKTPDAEIYTNVFKNITEEEADKFQYKIINNFIRSKRMEDTKVMGKYNAIMDMTRFQKANYEVSKEWLHQTENEKTTYFLAVEEMKLVGKGMAIPLMNEIIKNETDEEGKEERKEAKKETEEEKQRKRNKEKYREQKKGKKGKKNKKAKEGEFNKQNCEIKAAKNLLEKFRKRYKRLPVRVIVDSLYPSEQMIKLLEGKKIEYIMVLRDEKIPTITEEYNKLNDYKENRENKIEKETPEEMILIKWVNGIDYKEVKVNVIVEMRVNKGSKEVIKWMWITNREVKERNVEKIIMCGKMRDYIENQGFKEQKRTSGFDLEHVYSKNMNTIKMIYTIIQICHMIIQIIEHSDIIGKFEETYGSVKEYNAKFYADLLYVQIDEKNIEIKIQIRFPNERIII